jgi:predicted nucleic acid-binding protein
VTESAERGLLDTSIFIAQEAGYEPRSRPSVAAVSVVTMAELYLGVLAASEAGVRATRLRTLSLIESNFDPIPIDADVARAFAELINEARRQDLRPGINDAWIAATAIAHAMPVYTQDQGFARMPIVRAIIV